MTNILQNPADYAARLVDFYSGDRAAAAEAFRVAVEAGDFPGLNLLSQYVLDVLQAIAPAPEAPKPTHRDVELLKEDGKYFEAGQLAKELGHDRYYGCHVGMRSTREASREEFYRGYDAPRSPEAILRDPHSTAEQRVAAAAVDAPTDLELEGLKVERTAHKQTFRNATVTIQHDLGRVSLCILAAAYQSTQRAIFGRLLNGETLSSATYSYRLVTEEPTDPEGEPAGDYRAERFHHGSWHDQGVAFATAEGAQAWLERAAPNSPEHSRVVGPAVTQADLEGFDLVSIDKRWSQTIRRKAMLDAVERLAASIGIAITDLVRELKTPEGWPEADWDYKLVPQEPTYDPSSDVSADEVAAWCLVERKEALTGKEGQEASMRLTLEHLDSIVERNGLVGSKDRHGLSGRRRVFEAMKRGSRIWTSFRSYTIEPLAPKAPKDYGQDLTREGPIVPQADEGFTDADRAAMREDAAAHRILAGSSSFPGLAEAVHGEPTGTVTFSSSGAQLLLDGRYGATGTYEGPEGRITFYVRQDSANGTSIGLRRFRLGSTEAIGAQGLPEVRERIAKAFLELLDTVYDRSLEPGPFMTWWAGHTELAYGDARRQWQLEQRNASLARYAASRNAITTEAAR